MNILMMVFFNVQVNSSIAGALINNVLYRKYSDMIISTFNKMCSHIINFWGSILEELTPSNKITSET